MEVRKIAGSSCTKPGSNKFYMGTEVLPHVLLTLMLFLQYARFKQTILSSMDGGEKQNKEKRTNS